VLIVGAAGGVGHFAAQLAALSNAQVTGIVRHPERLGVWSIAGLQQTARDAVDLKEPFDDIIELVGGPAINAVIPLLADQGTWLLMKGYPQAEVTLDMTPFLRRWNAQMRTLFLYSPTSEPEHVGPELGVLAELIAAGKVTPLIGWQGSWLRLPEACAAMRAGNVAGKAVFTIEAM
jgi:NADPH:quinone reductase-like Zn-dependent oxidoreductase